MLKKNYFSLNKLKTIVIMGAHSKLEELIKINYHNGIKTIIITTSNQSHQINKNIKVKKFDKINKKFDEFLKCNCNIKNTLFISISARYIFKKKTIRDIFHNNLINFHGSRLPLDAGGGGYSWRILREDKIDSQLCHMINDKIDDGPILDQEISLFPKNCKVPIDYEKFHNDSFVNFYEKIIKKIKYSKIKLMTNSKHIGRYNPRLLTKLDGAIDWDLDPHQLYNFINAFDDPYEGAFSYLNNGKHGKLKIKHVHLHGGDSSNHPFMSGLVSRHDKKWLVVSTRSKYMLLIEKVLNNKNINIIDKIKVGDRFYTPLNDLVKARKKRVFFNSKGLKPLS